MTSISVSPEETFDPASPEEWESFRALSHRMVDDMIAYLATLRDRPAWREMPATVRAALAQPIPYAGIGAEAVYEEFVQNVLPYPDGNLHPRFFGWVKGNGTPLGMMADMLAAGLNPHMAGFNQAPALVEQQLIDWLATLLGMPGGSGVLVTGGTMASTLALDVARFATARKIGIDVREDGVQIWSDSSQHQPFVFYGSAETHGWARKAAEFMGLGNRAFRRVPVGADYAIDLSTLREMVAADRAEGMIPFCVVGTAGTVNTGASDDLTALADFCVSQDIWFHVDGAFGALAYLSEKLRPQLAGLERADSIGFDLHKWGDLPFECACVLVRDPEVHTATFAAPASYLATLQRGVIAGGLPFADRGLDLTRGFKALKAWMSLKADGVDKLVRLIEQNVAQTRYLVERVTSEAHLELLAPAPLNIACIRYAPAGVSDDTLDAMNTEILLRLQETGIAIPSSTIIDGHFAIRVANVNHRATLGDIDALLDGILRIGRDLRSQMELNGWPSSS
ncbi:MAG: pyridoxal-dependent decarboxylase [Gemmatimonadaceae bacterium]